MSLNGVKFWAKVIISRFFTDMHVLQDIQESCGGKTIPPWQDFPAQCSISSIPVSCHNASTTSSLEQVKMPPQIYQLTPEEGTKPLENQWF